MEHAEVSFAAVRVADASLLEGDGYERWLEPFRTIEDIHVHAALLGYSRCRRAPRLAARGPRANPRAARGAARHRRRAPLAPEVHVALGGALGLARKLLTDTEAHWDAVPQDERDRWRRDRALLGVAGKARAQRLESAWAALAGREGR